MNYMNHQDLAMQLTIKSNQQLYLAEQKLLLKEHERERRKAQYEEMRLDTEGKIEIKTKNLYREAKKREVANFICPEIVILRRLENTVQTMFVFSCIIDKDIRFVLLEPQRCESASYLLKKLSSIGGEIYAPTLAMRKSYVLQLLTLIVSTSNKSSMLPDRRGWYSDENGNVQIFQGEWTWEEAVLCVKQ